MHVHARSRTRARHDPHARTLTHKQELHGLMTEIGVELTNEEASIFPTALPESCEASL